MTDTGTPADFAMRHPEGRLPRNRDNCDDIDRAVVDYLLRNDPARLVAHLRATAVRSPTISDALIANAAVEFVAASELADLLATQSVGLAPAHVTC